MTRLLSRDYVMPTLLLLPMVSYWLLPSGMEIRLTYSSPQLIFFLPNIFYFIYLVKYRNDVSSDYIETKTRRIVTTILSFCWFYAFINTIMEGGQFFLLSISCSLNWIYLSLIFFNFPLTKKQIENTKYIIIPTLMILTSEYILFATGILSYTAETGNDLGGLEYSGIMRVSSTIGGSTGTALILDILGIICTSCYKIPEKLRLVLITISTIAIFFTVSRSSVVVWSLYLCLLLYLKYFRNVSLKKRTVALIIASLGLFVLNSYGVFNPIIERSEILTYNDEVLSNRDDRSKQAIAIARGSYWLGVGAGQVFPDKVVRATVHVPHYLAPHNFYMLILAEHGIGVFILVLYLLLFLICKLSFLKPQNLGFILLLLISFNSEGCVADAEFWAAIVFFYSIIKCKNENTLYLSS